MSGNLVLTEIEDLDTQKRIWISGRVQGVGFRFSTAREATKKSGLRGYVRNLRDGRVEAVFCGSDEAVRALIEWCKKGPPSAQVTHVEVRDESPDPALPLFVVT